MILKTTPDEWLRDMLRGVEADVVVCGHTHMQFDRTVDDKRVVNAGSVGLPYGAPGLTGCFSDRMSSTGERPMTPRRPLRVEAGGWPKAAEIAAENIRTVPSEEEALSFFEDMARQQWAERYPGSQ